MARDTAKWFDAEKGSGFIAPAEGGGAGPQADRVRAL
ncbi:cold-shock protein [Streptomyces pactum]|nr:cold-shock protein [Streptomyces pactum]